MVDHVSDSFLDTNVPLIMLMEAAQSGNGMEVEDCCNMFMGHVEKLQKVQYLCFDVVVVVVVDDIKVLLRVTSGTGNQREVGKHF